MGANANFKRVVVVLATPLALTCWQGVASAESLALPVSQPSASGVIGGANDVVGGVVQGLPGAPAPVKKVEQVLPAAPAPVEEIKKTVEQVVADPVGAVTGVAGKATAIPNNVVDSAQRIVETQPTTASEPGTTGIQTSSGSSTSYAEKSHAEENARVAQRSQRVKPRGEKEKKQDDTRSIAEAGKHVRGTRVLGDSIFAFPRGDRGFVPTETSALPFTGGEIVAALLLGAALLAAGSALLAWARWRPALCRAALTFSIL